MSGRQQRVMVQPIVSLARASYFGDPMSDLLQTPECDLQKLATGQLHHFSHAKLAETWK
jgi:hypothetical protein